MSLTESQRLIVQECEAIKERLLTKNRKYGDAALHPKRIFSKANAIEQINVRIDDKLSRKESDQLDEDEDIDFDIIGYLILKRVAQQIHSNEVLESIRLTSEGLEHN